MESSASMKATSPVATKPTEPRKRRRKADSRRRRGSGKKRRGAAEWLHSVRSVA